MKRSLYFIIFLAGFYTASGQVSIDSTDRDQLDYNPSAEQKNMQDEGVKKLHTEFQVGSSFIYSPGNFYGPALYAAPALSYRLNPRFVISAGAGIEAGNFYPLYNAEGISNSLLPMTRFYIFTRGEYYLTERLTLGGTAYKGISRIPRLSEYSSPYQQDFQAIGVDLNYKVTPSFSIGVHMRFQNSPYYQNNELIPPEGYVPWGGY